ncbi:MAG: TVP38/TMEM64 family protein, partial [Acidobacteriota bacterium]
GVLMLSRYFDWYGHDFTALDWSPRAGSIAAFVARYATPKVKAFIESAGGKPEISFLDYDWTLNAAPPEDPDGSLPASAAGQAPEKTGLVVRLRRSITDLGPAGMLIYALAYAVLTVFFVPASALTIGAGVAYGVVLGTVVVSVGSVSGAAAAFLIGRYLLRSRVEKWLEGKTRFEAIDRAVAQQGWRIVGLTRLSPVFPFNLLNYAYALTAVRFWPYVLASWIAMLPGTLLYVYIGAASAEVADAATGGTGGWGRTALQIVGVLATLVVTVMITRMARRALAESAGPAGIAEDS